MLVYQELSNGSGKYIDVAPNTDLKSKFNGTGSTKITWSWAYGSEWAYTADAVDTTLENWENTTVEDLCDTLLGEMISLAAGDTTGYKVAVGAKGDGTLTEVKYAQVPESGTATKSYVAYTGDSAPATAAATETNIKACLTVGFGARVTVEQID